MSTAPPMQQQWMAALTCTRTFPSRLNVDFMSLSRSNLAARPHALCSSCLVAPLAGLLMPPLPGPGLIPIAAGLVLLATDVPFAHRLLERVRRRLPADADGKVPRRAVFMGLAVSTVTIGFSAWWTFLR